MMIIQFGITVAACIWAGLFPSPGNIIGALVCVAIDIFLYFGKH